MNLLKKIRAAYHQRQAFRYHKKIQRYRSLADSWKLNLHHDHDGWMLSRDYEEHLKGKGALHHAKWLAAVTKGEESN